MATANALQTTSTVQQHYERFPYPHRIPSDETNRFLFTPLDDLATLNYYCFQGKRNVRNGFRVLVAGGGTGDSTIHLAEQLRGIDSVIIHLDLSESSIEIARLRAAVRKLDNITWMQGSLLDLSDSDLEPFDYVNCSGVLHHLHNPAEGLQALKAVLKNDGAMGLMLYGKQGRTGIYHMQELMRLVNRNEIRSETKIANTREVLDLLPETNWYKKAGKLYAVDGRQGDEEITDLFLHSADHPFTVPEIYDLLDAAGLKLVEFLPGSRALYDPRMAFRDANVLETVLKLPHSDQQGAAELYWGTIQQHDFWASALDNSVADFNDKENVPFFSRVSQLKKIPELLKNHTGDQWSMNVECSGSIMLHLSLEYSETARRFVELINAQRTLGEIRQLLESESPSGVFTEDIRETCRTVFETLRSYDLVLLRHQSVPAFRTSF